MTSSVTLFAAFGGGLISFLSPCVLPIVPAYLSIITGLEVGEVRDGKGHLRRIARDTALFIAGFSSVFILLGLSATAVGSALFDNQGTITRISGLVVPRSTNASTERCPTPACSVGAPPKPPSRWTSPRSSTPRGSPASPVAMS
ncbi:MAG: cytochrome c biogenesis protein CcdA [Acidimicrobiales bacterium]|nr:cytochrome c biogenesis protein CcdA [Acidimicrobiales bacterium]